MAIGRALEKRRRRLEKRIASLLALLITENCSSTEASQGAAYDNRNSSDIRRPIMDHHAIF
jgi:hypothetical protein